MHGKNARRNRTSLLALAAAGVGFGVISGEAAAQTQPVYFDVNGATSTPASGVTEGGTYSWEDANWGTSNAGDVATGNYPANVIGSAGFPRFAAGLASASLADATVSYTVTANADHLCAGMFLEDGAAGTTLTLNGTGVISIDPGTGPQGFIVRGGSNLRIENKISGTGGINFQSSGGTGTGSLFLYAANDYSGGTILNTGGTLNINSAASIGSGPLSWTSAAASLADPDAAGPITLTHPVTGRATASTLTLVSPDVAPFTFSGGWTLGGTLATPVTTTLAIGNAAFPNTVTTISGVIGGAGSNLTKTNAGTLVLTGANTYVGNTTTFGGGVLSISSDGNLGAIPLTPTAAAISIAGATTGGTLRATATFALDANRGVTINPGLPAGGPPALGGTIDVTGVNTLTVPGVVTGTGKLTKIGTGTLVLSNANTYAGGTTVSAGTLLLGNADATAGDAIDVADSAFAQAQNGLAKAVTVTTLNTNTTGKFDLTNNSMVVKGMTVAQVQAEIVKSFNAGQWNGASGLTSSTAAVALPAVTAIGFADNGILNRTEFKGVTPLNATDVLVKYTYYGDSDLNGATTLDDYTLFLNGYQTAGTTWVQGDYDYNGLVTLDDFTLFLAGYQQQGAPLSELESLINNTPMSAADRSAMLAAVQAVPEPTAMGLMALLGGTRLLGRRRNRTGTRASATCADAQR
jgi:autotransporter-associated beta strand protein